MHELTKLIYADMRPALGVTEPGAIAIAYAAAKAREVLGCEADMVKIGVSNNIIKNVKSVIVPNTDGVKGIEAAAVAGIVAGDEKQFPTRWSTPLPLYRVSSATAPSPAVPRKLPPAWKRVFWATICT